MFSISSYDFVWLYVCMRKRLQMNFFGCLCLHISVQKIDKAGGYLLCLSQALKVQYTKFLWHIIYRT